MCRFTRSKGLPSGVLTIGTVSPLLKSLTTATASPSLGCPKWRRLGLRSVSCNTQLHLLPRHREQTGDAVMSKFACPHGVLVGLVRSCAVGGGVTTQSSVWFSLFLPITQTSTPLTPSPGQLARLISTSAPTNWRCSSRSVS